MLGTCREGRQMLLYNKNDTTESKEHWHSVSRGYTLLKVKCYPVFNRWSIASIDIATLRQENISS